MTTETALDLSEMDPAEWRVLVNEVIYGPYTLGQMVGFIAEKRVGPRTQVAEGDGGAFLPAREHRPLVHHLNEALRPSSQPEPADDVSNYLIIAKLTGTGETQLVSAMNRLGKFAEIMPGVWALRSSVKHSRLREQLNQTVTSADQVMIANASTGRLAWLNLGPEADVHIRRVWNADLD
ncbi:hypothetical protein D1224_03515 [Henriciella barbarensis]|uniref:DUF4339 domain-containing protein n=1 Tax=Henriciella barbarensis TaxID=86342 RepID=A0A399QWS2_9PROT|nr:hypothetical protein [Henriciella barbarensis]RIJ23350.1 hypothetical protein D1224_03515 [Henriciella barbarensis]